MRGDARRMYSSFPLAIGDCRHGDGLSACNGAFEQRLNCPKCGVSLLYQVTRRLDSPSANGHEDDWQQTPWGKLIVGLLLAQGTYYVLRHLCTAGLLATSDEVHGVWQPQWSDLMQALQGVSVLGAGLLIGAGQRRGFLFGTLMGVWNGVLFVIAQNWLGRPTTTVSLFGEPILQAAFGAIGGLIGSMIWKPLQSLNLAPEIRIGKPARRCTGELSILPAPWLGARAVGRHARGGRRRLG